MSTTATTRRALRILGAATISLTLLAACGSDSKTAATTAAPTVAPTTGGLGTNPGTTLSTGTSAPSGSTETTAAEDEPTPTSGPAQPADVANGAATVEVTVGTDDFTTSKGTRVVSVPKGTAVTIKITDPSADQEYHLHGYDIELAAKKGETATFNFTADQTGQFDLESHDTEQTLLVIVVG